jgi:hypothetical protein
MNDEGARQSPAATILHPDAVKGTTSSEVSERRDLHRLLPRYRPTEPPKPRRAKDAGSRAQKRRNRMRHKPDHRTGYFSAEAMFYNHARRDLPRRIKKLA